MKNLKSYLSGVAIGIVGTLSANPASAWTVTATGTIISSPAPFGTPSPFTTSFDNANLFALGGTSLVGQSYSLTITTDPWLNQFVELVPTAGGGFNGIFSYNVDPASQLIETAAGYTLTVTVGGQSFSQSFFRTVGTVSTIASLYNGLSHNYGVPPFEDSLSESIAGSGCSLSTSTYSSNGTPCVIATILAGSGTTPFVPYLDFNLVTTLSLSAPPPGNQVEFSFINTDNSATDSTQLYGQIESLTVNTNSLDPGEHRAGPK